MGKLDGKIALVTGGTTGIGAATARLFQAEGATVVVTGSNPQTLDAARGALPGVDVIASEAGDVAATVALVEQVKARYGRIDVLFVNAGVARFAPAAAVDEAFFDFQFDINVKGAYFVLKHAIPAMPDGGAVVLTSSVAGVKGLEAGSVYAATKAAVRSFARTFAAELAPRGIRVNAISPGLIETPIFGKVGLPPEQMAGLVASIPMKRIGKADDVAHAALYLASDDAAFVTGIELFVDGGTGNL